MKRILNILGIFVAIIGVAGLNTIFHVCTNDKAMKCNATSNAVSALFITLIIVHILCAHYLNSKALTIVSLLIVCNITLLPAFLIGGCQKMDMACRVKAFPFIYVICTVLVVLNLSVLFIKSTSAAGGAINDIS